MKLNVENMEMIEFFHRLPFEKKMNKKTRHCFKEIYDIIKEAPSFHFASNPMDGIVFTLNRKIDRIEESEYLPMKIANYINLQKKQHFQYEVFQDGRYIFIHFLVFKKVMRKKYDEYVKYMLQVLFTLNHFSYKKCAKSKEFHIYLYMTPFKKLLPVDEVIGADNVNTGINKKDWNCSDHEEVNEIVIFREEDWFKVFIHESIHSFRLDFNDAATKEIQMLFPVKSDINLFEAYTEFWAKMLNMLFCSIFLEKRNNFDKVMEIMNLLISVDIKYSLFQVVKVLHFMGLAYSDLINGINLERYKEDTNVLSYFVLNLCLMNHYNLFIEYCKENSHNVLNFNESRHLVNFIKSWYKDDDLLKDIEKMEQVFKRTRDDRLLKNIKMTLFELK